MHARSCLNSSTGDRGKLTLSMELIQDFEFALCSEFQVIRYVSKAEPQVPPGFANLFKLRIRI
jgi:hypothetical protein